MTSRSSTCNRRSTWMPIISCCTSASGWCTCKKDMQLQAIDEMKRAVTLSGRSTETLTGLAQAYAAAEMRDDMQKVVDEMHQQAERRYVSPYNVSRVHAA